MKQRAPQTQYKQLFDGLRRTVGLKPETPEDGFLTVSDWANETGYSLPQSLRILKEGVKSGKVETKRFRVACGQRILFVDHYKVKV